MSGQGRAVEQPQEWRRGCGAGVRRGLGEPACGCNYGGCEDAVLQHWKCIALPPHPSPPLAAFPHQKPRFLLLLLAGKASSWRRRGLEGGLPSAVGAGRDGDPSPGTERGTGKPVIVNQCQGKTSRKAGETLIMG